MNGNEMASLWRLSFDHMAGEGTLEGSNVNALMHLAMRVKGQQEFDRCMSQRVGRCTLKAASK